MADLMEAITSLAKRRGFAFPSSEIYGGIRSSWDYGPLGVELKRNVRSAWWRSMVQLRDDVVGLESSIIMSPQVWEASGHLESFADPLVECLSCHQRFREDHLPASRGCPNCGQKQWTDARNFNLMFKTHMGPVEEEGAAVYRRAPTSEIEQAFEPKRDAFPLAREVEGIQGPAPAPSRCDGPRGGGYAKGARRSPQEEAPDPVSKAGGRPLARNVWPLQAKGDGAVAVDGHLREPFVRNTQELWNGIP